MGASRRLDRGLDTDLIARIEASGKPVKLTGTTFFDPRHAYTYRGARRLFYGKAFRPSTEDLVKHRTLCPPRIELNRSRRWRSASSYAEAAIRGEFTR